ncbi:sulfotransferase domain-containing protein [Maritimibacter dapengensis]|uniref:Sulfotransferase domain-containing protein n=1 Tax=Maritimibacter dapengensis TaxID=2836868 RepID=A0ABS6SXS2_9RHOB|nr:sulfotransferase domain-containing protein [Maritimibacter dapengensis]MBV7377764.1 sulfotransferase domain-containing protein [Maritimibacter dapengensis]
MATIDKDALTRSVYLFGSVTHGPYGLMTFSPRGRVTTRYHANEYKYGIDGDVLSLMRADGTVTSRMKLDADGRHFVPHDGPGHYLTPQLALDPAEGTSLMPPVFVNTLPKAGTYLVAKALSNIGYQSLDLHVMDSVVHDNRGVDEADIHFDPWSRELPVSARAVAALIRRGEFAVGHLSDQHEMQAFANQRVRLINVIREPRSMLLSFFTFVQAKVKPSAEQELWAGMDGIDAFKAFLLCQPIDRWLGQTQTMAEHFDCLRYEDLKAGKVARKAVGTALSTKLGGGLKSALGQKTATFIEGDRDASHEWFRDPQIAAYLEARGVNDVSRAYWPELN